MRKAFSLLEVVVASAIGLTLLLPLLSLSSRTTRDQDLLSERTLAHNMALDMVERFKRYKLDWAPPPVGELYGPLELDPGRQVLFDRLYAAEFSRLGIHPRPHMKVTPDPRHAGLFRLDVSVDWTSPGGRSHRLAVSRYCYAP